ncbi:MAG: cyclic nucleotide-binding domain-containing protein, partial [Rhodospirillaceae bacterium]|nr:cyclic nucleotide-binding domain-containing protein [Rhodospirillaceae bacterium]
MANDLSFQRLTIDSHKMIFDEGDEGDAAYLISQGVVEIRQGTKGQNPQRLATLKKGDIFGEMALFDNRPRMAAAVTMEATELVAISRQEFNARMETVDPVLTKVVLYL